MTSVELGPRRLLRLILSVGAGLLVLAATQHAVWADGHTFILPTSSGYGISDCLGKSPGCSEIVASAVCESYGYAAPIAYGRAEDMTATIATPLKASDAGDAPAKIDPDAFVVTCGN